ncbi:MAG: adenylate/guanylate cyclase domain-containing protein [Actinomycetota bacterium]
MAACQACGADNPSGARFCNACGERLPPPAPAAEVRKTVTVVFCDVTRSTALGERLDPEALRRVMSRYFATMTHAIERHGGTVEKFIGDAVMAVFGIPTAHEDDALRAVRAAGEMRDGLRLLNKELERDQGANLECRIGISTGEVVAGDASARQALVTGDPVNVAARLEQVAPVGEVLLSDTTLRLVRDAVVTEILGPLELRGKSDRVPAHRLVAIHAGAAGFARRLDSPLVGRSRQLAQLRQAFEDVTAERVCHLFTILGPPGVGKSRLVQEAIEGFALEATVLRGRCLSYGEGITYWPLAEIVRDALGPAHFDDPGVMMDALASLIAHDPSATDVAARITQLIGASAEIPLPPEEIGWAVRRFLEGLARSRPLVVVLEDLHWAESSLLDLVDQVTDLSRDAPILIACMARPELLEVRPGWGGGKLYASTLTLEPLSLEESEQLVGNLLGGESLDEPTRHRILAAAEGNPLFVEETLSMLIDDGSLRREGDTWTPTRELGDVSVPPTIQALLAARLDLLEEAERITLGRASLVGQVFYLGAVRDLAPEEDRAATLRHIQQLVRRDLVRPDVSDLPGQDAFRFRHSLLRDAAYQMLPKEARADLHERFADWLDRAASSVDVDEFVGYHLEKAHAHRVELGPEDERSRTLAERAADRLSAAGSKASDRADTPAVQKLLARAAALRRQNDPRRAWDLVALGWAHLDAASLNEGRRVFAEALDAARAAGDERAEAHAELGGTFADCLFDPEGAAETATALLERLVPRFEAWGDDRGLARAYYSRAQIPWIHCQFGRAREDCTLALRHARAAGDGTFERVAATTRVVGGILGSSHVDQIRADLAEIAPHVARLPSLRHLTGMGEGVIAGLQGRFDEARRLLGEAQAVSAEILGRENGALLAWSRHVEMLAGDPAAAEAYARRSYEWLHGAGDLAHSSTAAGDLAITLLELGRTEDARRLAAECRETSASDDMANQFIWRAVDARLLAAEGRLDEAAGLIREAARWAEQTDMLFDQAQIALEEANICRMAGRMEDARSALRRAREAAQRKGATVLVERADRRLAEFGL